MSSRLHPDSRGGFAVLRSKRRFTDSSFSIAAPSAWNYLPSNIRTSKTYIVLIQTQGSPLRFIICNFVFYLYFVFLLLPTWRIKPDYYCRPYVGAQSSSCVAP